MLKRYYKNKLKIKLKIKIKNRYETGLEHKANCKLETIKQTNNQKKKKKGKRAKTEILKMREH